jgi:hypothetical protein
MTVNTPRHLPTTMSRRRLLAGLVATPVLAAFVAACGDDTVEPAGSDPGTSDPGASDGSASTVPSTEPGAIAHPTDAATAVLRIAFEGGFVPVEFAFVNQPTLLVSGDGRAFVPGAVPAIYPGPLVAPMGVRTISEAGIQTLLRLARDAGLLAPPPDYTAELNIADAPDTVVTITTADGTWEHRAYALMMGDGPGSTDGAEPTPARQTLADFVRAATDLSATVGDTELGAETIFEPAEYRLRATATDEGKLGGLDPAPTFADWPASTGFDLATAAECARISAEAVGSLFADATQLTYFRQDGLTYSLAVAPVLPGDDVC